MTSYKTLFKNQNIIIEFHPEFDYLYIKSNNPNFLPNFIFELEKIQRFIEEYQCKHLFFNIRKLGAISSMTRDYITSDWINSLISSGIKYIALLIPMVFASGAFDADRIDQFLFPRFKSLDIQRQFFTDYIEARNWLTTNSSRISA